ncbi:hypothetical protein OG203_41615 [Nocardia sp. NBC_01499]|uniref:hypothetical protein n=1 Tax=Nocardia sp. NBC_01499 TaxID=2903597 RepID=UPI0038632FB7
MLYAEGSGEVWVTTADGHRAQIAGHADNPAPGLDTGGKPLDQPQRQLIERLFYHHPGRDDPSR